jgi:hypothetical protein
MTKKSILKAFKAEHGFGEFKAISNQTADMNESHLSIKEKYRKKSSSTTTKHEFVLSL